LTKLEIREQYLQKRNSLSAEDRWEIEQYVFDKVLDIISRKSCGTVHCYIGNPEKDEFPTLQLIEKIWLRNIQVCAPRMDKGRKLNSYLIHSDSKLELHPFGILEPPPLHFIDAANIDLVLVPLLVHDHNLHRLGYGGGYYDRYLPTCSNAYKLGMSYFEPIAAIPDVEATDVALDEVVWKV